jgi:glycosyltransferase involved in cell wall biosynthesis
MSELPNNGKAYVLATAAYNEEAYLERLIGSVVSQTVRPKKWIIVSDGSTDGTDEIAQRYANQYSFIQVLRITEEHPRNFAAQVNAINAGFAQLKGMDYAYIGNLDADVSFEPSYFAALLDTFEKNPDLGVAGGSICEEHGAEFSARRGNRVRSVPLAVQLFRRECYEAFGGYVPLKYGGPDWYAEIVARMKGWRVESLPELRAFHHRPTGTADRLLRYVFSQGCLDYSVGSYPLFEILKCIRRLPERPLITGAVVRLAAFAWSYCRREKRQVPQEIVDFLRSEQRERLKAAVLGRRTQNSCRNRQLTAKS